MRKPVVALFRLRVLPEKGPTRVRWLVKQVGAVVGNILVSHTAEVIPWIEGNPKKGHHARAGGTQHRFTTHFEALAYARQAAIAQVTTEACSAGAVAPSVDIEEIALAGDRFRLVARAAGKPL